MKRALITALMVCTFVPSAQASFVNELKELPGNFILIGSTTIKLADSGMHWLWDNLHNKFVHPMASSLAGVAETVTFNTVDLNGDGK